MKKHLYTLFAGICLLASTTSYNTGPQEANIGNQLSLYTHALGILAIGGAIGMSVYHYGQRFTKAAAAAVLTTGATWHLLNKAALSGTLSRLAEASSVPLIPQNSILNITPAAILGSLCFGSLAFYAIYQYFHTDDYTHSSTVKTQTWHKYN
jgi:hypothetical protein